VAKPSAAPRRLQSLLIRGSEAPDVHVPLIAGGGHGPTPAVAEVGGTTPERMGESVATVETAGRGGEAPEMADPRRVVPEHGSKRAAPEARAGHVGLPSEERLGALQDVSLRLQPLSSVILPTCLLTLAFVFRSHADTGVLRLGPLKRLALRAQIISPEPQPQPPSTRLVPSQAEEASSVVAETRAPTTPPPPAPATAVEEGEAATEATVTQAALEAPFEAGPSIEGVVVVLDEDSAPPPASESHDAAAVPALQPAPMPAALSLLPAVKVPVPSPAVEVQGPPPTTEVRVGTAGVGAERRGRGGGLLPARRRQWGTS
jgi:hypothetical protein